MLLTDDVGYPRVYIEKASLPYLPSDGLRHWLEQHGFLVVQRGDPAFCWWLNYPILALSADAAWRGRANYVAVPYPYLSDAELQRLRERGSG